MTILVEGFDGDALALARFLALEGHDVRVAGRTEIPEQALDLRELGVRLQPNVDLDADPGAAEIAYLDVWTPPVALRVQRLRSQGTRVSCLGDLLLERWGGVSIGITGTAGKTTTTSLVANVLRAAGIDLAVSAGARAGNLWPTGDLLGRLTRSRRTERGAMPVLLLELTSSHLAFMQSSPTIAAVISFWPDHLELHGDLHRYRAAKEVIVGHQRPGDAVVVNADDVSRGFADATPADLVEFSRFRRVERGAFVGTDGRIVMADPTGETFLPALHERATHPTNVLAAVAIAGSAGADPAAIEHGIRTATPPPWRAQSQGELVGIPVLDDGMAATPSKTAATLSAFPDRSIVLIAGGLTDAGGGPVHATTEEIALLERACDEVARSARVVVAFGDAAGRLSELLEKRGVVTYRADDLAEAVFLAAAHASHVTSVVFSPLFPLPLEERARFASLVRAFGNQRPMPGR